MRLLQRFSVFLTILVALVLSTSIYAQSDTGLNARVFGQGQPDSIQSPPPGKLKNRLKSLPPQASSSVDGEGDSASFSAVERTRIVDIWHRVIPIMADMGVAWFPGRLLWVTVITGTSRNGV